VICTLPHARSAFRHADLLPQPTSARRWRAPAAPAPPGRPPPGHRLIYRRNRASHRGMPRPLRRRRALPLTQHAGRRRPRDVHRARAGPARAGARARPRRAGAQRDAERRARVRPPPRAQEGLRSDGAPTILYYCTNLSLPASRLSPSYGPRPLSRVLAHMPAP
jgi:hypothetical protein